MRPGRRGNTFDFLRLVAAFAVVIQHATVHLDARFLWVDPHDDWWFYDGVHAFFIISGYFVFRSALRLSAGNRWYADFFVNRGLRIIPAIWVYLVVVLVALIAVSVLSWRDLVDARTDAWILSTLLLVPVYSPPSLSSFGVGVINGSLWTIPAEVSFYALVPVLVVAGRRLGQTRMVSLLLAAGLVLGAAQGVIGRGLVGKLYGITCLPYLWFFGLGMAWFVLESTVRLTWPRVGLALPAYAVLASLGRHSSDVPSVLFGLSAAIPLSYVLMTIGRRGPELLSRFTAAVGDLSFGVYIWHMVVINLVLWSGLRARLGGAPLFVLVLGLTFLLAWLSWILVERRALARKRRSSRREPARVPDRAAW